MPLDKDDHLYLVDGSGFIFRAFHALPPLTRKSDGVPIGAVSGFCNMMWKLVADAREDSEGAPTHMAVVFDASSKTFRNDLYDQYKANRSETPEDLIPQFPMIRDAVRAFSIACVEQEGYEADDLIATYTREARQVGARVTIVSSDKDLMQLVGPGVVMFDGMKNVTIDEDGVYEKFGVTPDLVIDVQALAGDSVDNIPGAPGIGVKTAALLMDEFGSLDALLERAAEVKQPKRRQTLIDHADQIRLSKVLVTLKDDVPDAGSAADFMIPEPDATPLLDFLGKMELNTLTRRVATAYDREVPEPKVAPAPVLNTTPAGEDGALPPIDPRLLQPVDHSAYETVTDMAALTIWLDRARQRGYVAIDTETTSLNEMVAELVGVSLAVEPGSACYVPLAHMEGDGDLLGAMERAPGQIDFEIGLAAIRDVLEDPAILKIGHNLKYDAKVLANYGIGIAPFDDTMLIAYAQGSGGEMSGGYGMDALSKAHLNHTPIPIKELIGAGKSQVTFDKVSIEKAAPYAAEDADVTLRLWHLFKPRLPAMRATTVYETLERPLMPVLAAMERHGIAVDRDMLSRLSNGFSQRMAELEDEIYKLADERFNIGSPKQLGEILFGKLGMQGGKKTKTGAYATGADILEDLAMTYDLPGRILDWRQLSKLKSTYTDSLQTHINADTGRVHTSFSMAATSTGRLASTDPNLQNIPIRTQEGREIRKAFVPEDGNVLVSLDYSQIELRILAHMADIDSLKTAFAEGQDIHAATASAMFGVPLDEMTPEIRRRAKAINFGVIYGISGHGLGRNLRIPRGEAQAFIDAYFEKFPGIRAYMDAMKAKAREDGYVETLFGRRIYTPNINARGPQRAYQERAAINAPIQGTAADVIRRAMIRVPAVLEAQKLSARMLLQVHDELVFECPAGEAEPLIGHVRAVMENAADPVVQFSTPLVVDAGQGDSWQAAH